MIMMIMMICRKVGVVRTSYSSYSNNHQHSVASYTHDEIWHSWMLHSNKEEKHRALSPNKSGQAWIYFISFAYASVLWR